MESQLKEDVLIIDGQERHISDLRNALSIWEQFRGLSRAMRRNCVIEFAVYQNRVYCSGVRAMVKEDLEPITFDGFGDSSEELPETVTIPSYVG